MIERDDLEEMFGQMAEAGVDTKRPLLWGYFFNDVDADKLEAASEKLEAMGYEIVDIYDAEPEDGEEDCVILHVQRVEQHDVDSLHQRNQELYAFAETHGLDAYDGMDVGSPDGEPLG